jgi:hypothetical protein
MKHNYPLKIVQVSTIQGQGPNCPVDQLLQMLQSPRRAQVPQQKANDGLKRKSFGHGGCNIHFSISKICSKMKGGRSGFSHVASH